MSDIRGPLVLIILLVGLFGCARKEASEQEMMANLYTEAQNDGDTTLNHVNLDQHMVRGNLVAPARGMPAKGAVAKWPASPPDNDVVPSPPPPSPQQPKKKPKAD